MAEQGGSGGEYEVLRGVITIDGDKADKFVEGLSSRVSGAAAAFEGLQQKITGVIGTLVAFGASWKGALGAGLAAAMGGGLVKSGVELEKLDKQLKSYTGKRDKYARDRLAAYSEEFEHPYRDAQAIMSERLADYSKSNIRGKEAIDNAIQEMRRAADIAAVKGREREDVFAAMSNFIDTGNIESVGRIMGWHVDKLAEVQKEIDKHVLHGTDKAEHKRWRREFLLSQTAGLRGGFARQDDLIKDVMRVAKAFDELAHMTVERMIPAMRDFVQTVEKILDWIKEPDITDIVPTPQSVGLQPDASTLDFVKKLAERQKHTWFAEQVSGLAEKLGIIGASKAAGGALKSGAVGTGKFLNEIAVPGPRKASDLFRSKDSLGGPQSAAPQIIINQHGVNMNDPAAVKTAAMTGAEQALQKLLGRSRFYGTEKLA